MTLSIIIPALNEQQSLPATLQALQAARRRGSEILVVDGGSRDDTAGVCAGLVDLFLSGERGRARQMNAGAARASGSTLLFLHADTLAPAAIDQLIDAALDGKPGWGRFDVRLSGQRRSLRLIEWLMNLRSRVSGIATGDQGLFVSRVWFRQVGAYPQLDLMEDIALSKRLRRLARPHCLKTRLVTSSRRWEQQGVARTVIKMWWLRAAFFCGLPARYLARQYE